MFQIFVDSAADLPAVTAAEYDIHVIPFINDVDGKMIPGFEPGLTPEQELAKGKDYYDAIRNGAHVKTGLVNTEDFIKAFTPALENGDDMLYVSLSKNISGTYNAARLAMEALAEDYPDRKMCAVDSLNAGLAQGILSLYASILRGVGKTAAETADLIGKAVAGMNGVFTVGNLKYLVATGRVKNVTAVIGNMLSLKVILRGNEEGFITQFHTCRGRKKSLDTLADLVCSNIIDPAKQIIGIAHADALEDAKYVAQKIQEKIHVKEILQSTFDFCTGSHVGPDTIAVFFISAGRALNGTLAPKPELLDCIE